MIQIDETIFDEAGLGALTPEEKGRMLAYVQTTLQTRAGIRVAEIASNEQIEEFARLTEAGNDENVMSWLESSFPNFDAILQEELTEIKDELQAMATDVLKARE